MSKNSMKKLFPESFKHSKGAMLISTFALMIAFVVATVFSATTNEQASNREAKEEASKEERYANRFSGKSISTVAAKQYKVTDQLNMRSGAGTHYKKIGSLRKNTTVTYLSKKGSWYKVSYKGKKGYVSSKYLNVTSKVSRPNIKSGRTMYVSATAYTAYCNGCSGITRTGINLRKNPNRKVIAVDPRIIPLGSKVYVKGYGVAIAGDTGGAIKGHRIDIFKKTKRAANNWGRRTVKIIIL